MNSPLIRNIWAVGRNYADHAKEMKAELPKEPMFFLKAGTCIETGSKIVLPAWSRDVHHEIEIALWLNESLQISHLTLALDLTARDAQNLAKTKGLPWTLAKSFTGSCPLGRWLNVDDAPAFEELNFRLFKNQEPVQTGSAHNMIFKPSVLLEYVKNHYPVAPYDVILTGTPEGVGGIRSGDSLDAVLQREDREILTCHWDVV